jgi:hypothetical protein
MSTGSVAQGDLDVGAGDRVEPAQHALAPLPIGQRRDAQLAQGVVHEPAVTLGDHRLEVARAPLGGDLHGHDHVDAVRLAVGVLVHPREGLLELLGVVEADAAEDAETAGTAHRGCDVLGGGEGEDRVVDPERVAEVGAHGCLSMREVGAGLRRRRGRSARR